MWNLKIFFLLTLGLTITVLQVYSWNKISSHAFTIERFAQKQEKFKYAKIAAERKITGLLSELSLGSQVLLSLDPLVALIAIYLFLTCTQILDWNNLGEYFLSGLAYCFTKLNFQKKCEDDRDFEGISSRNVKDMLYIMFIILLLFIAIVSIVMAVLFFTIEYSQECPILCWNLEEAVNQECLGVDYGLKVIGANYVADAILVFIFLILERQTCLYAIKRIREMRSKDSLFV
eukprot:TRINITY_DN942_c1_g1_i1.p1 TRINITY_DN942_c1_g1~~TRINITY_DN942_c1_g1_i1.p1  ORF type:complete len:232 (-),score=28.38 TRINITY_DN942_c1_g1_i1:79-774(-)